MSDDIQMTKQEIAAFNGLNNTVVNCEAAHRDAIDARGAYLELVGIKYHATFDPTVGKFVPIEDDAEDTQPADGPPKAPPEEKDPGTK